MRSPSRPTFPANILVLTKILSICERSPTVGAPWFACAKCAVGACAQACARNVMREQTEFGQSRVLLGCLYIDDLCASLFRINAHAWVSHSGKADMHAGPLPREHTYTCTGMHAVLYSSIWQLADLHNTVSGSTTD